MKKNQPTPQEPIQAPAEGDKPGGLSLFGKLLVFLYETTFVVTIVVFGTIIGALLAIILPVGLPFLILWKRYVNGDGRKIPEVSRDG